MFRFVLLFALMNLANAQDQCGFPVTLARSGFEAGEQPASVVLQLENTPVTVTILGPANASTVGVRAIQVFGTFTGPANTGISVNGVSALTDGESFVSPRILLEPGVNILTIRYATTDAAPIEVTRNITYTASATPDVLFTAGSAGDYTPTIVPFALATKFPVGQNVITNVLVDYDGNGTFEVNGAQPTKLEYAYERAGLYVAKTIVTFDDGNSATPPVIVEDRARVLAQSLAFTRQTLCGVYYAMKNRLIQNQIALAVNTQSPKQQARMTTLWNALANAGRLNAVATRLGPIVDGQIARNTAEMLIAIATATAGQFDGFQVRFRKDVNGVWRIDAM